MTVLSVADEILETRRVLLRKLHALDELEREVAGVEPGFPWIELDAFRKELRTIETTKSPTGIPSLDAAMKGGLPGGVVFTLVGPPGSCKSALGIQLGLARARKVGGRLYVYAPDQGGAQSLTRLGETFGDITTDDLRFAKFTSELRGILRVADERQDGVSIETFRDTLLKAGDVAAVLIDTPQTVLTITDEEERGRINRAMDTARVLASKLLVPVFCPNHANRASSAAKRKEDRLHPRAAALGSAGVEHRSQVLAFMEKVDREDGVTEIDVVLPKVSFGSSGRAFRLVLNPATWQLHEVDAVATEDAAASAAAIKLDGEVREAEKRCIEIVKRNPGGLSGQAFEVMCGGRHTLHREARRRLMDRAELICEDRVGKGGGVLWKIACIVQQ